jgi:hypothetical protein
MAVEASAMNMVFTSQVENMVSVNRYLMCSSVGCHVQNGL